MLHFSYIGVYLQLMTPSTRSLDEKLTCELNWLEYFVLCVLSNLCTVANPSMKRTNVQEALLLLPLLSFLLSSSYIL